MEKTAAATIILLFFLILVIPNFLGKTEAGAAITATLTPVYAEAAESHHTIYDPTNWKIVTAVRLELYVTVNYQGLALSWSLSGSATWQIQDYYGNVLFTTTMPLSASGSSAPPNGQAFAALSATVDASTIESLGHLLYFPSNYYYLYVKLDSFSFTINFIDGAKTKSPSTLPSSSWLFYCYSY
jgi:hypothetical protein